MAEFRSIKVEKGSGGFGGPLIITPTGKKNKVMFITGGGAEPECLQKIVELSGLTPVNGFKTNCPEEELALVIIDCGGTLRCGIYWRKNRRTYLSVFFYIINWKNYFNCFIEFTNIRLQYLNFIIHSQYQILITFFYSLILTENSLFLKR